MNQRETYEAMFVALTFAGRSLRDLAARQSPHPHDEELGAACQHVEEAARILGRLVDVENISLFRKPTP